MNIAEFQQRFPAGTRIGFDLQADTATWFHDNGTEIGAWTVNRRTTVGSGELLKGEKAMAARQWYGKGRGR